MDFNRRLANYYQRWNVEFDQEKQFVQLKNRIILDANELVGKFLANNSEIDRQFKKALTFALAEEVTIEASRTIIKQKTALYQSLDNLKQVAEGLEFETTFGGTYVYKSIKESDNLVRLVTVLQILFWILERHECSQQIELAKRIREAVKLTPSVEFCLAIRGKTVTFYPPGAELLDEGTVNQVLAWLKPYPNVGKHFEQALEIYMAGDKGKYRNLLDNLRFALEQLLKNVLKNDKSLENQQNFLLPWLKKQSVHQNLIDMYQKLLFGNYTFYQNDAVKHTERFSEDEIEFMIYLTGAFMRLILQLAEKNIG